LPQCLIAPVALLHCHSDTSDPYDVLLLPADGSLAAKSKLQTLYHESIRSFLPADILLLSAFNMHRLLFDSIDRNLGDPLDGFILAIGIYSELVVRY
jgi:hypothetical protein